MADVGLEMLQAPVQRALDALAISRAEAREMRSRLLGLVDQGRRIEQRVAAVERRFDDLRHDLELMLKAELIGRLSSFETQLERRLDAIRQPLGPVE